MTIRQRKTATTTGRAAAVRLGACALIAAAAHGQPPDDPDSPPESVNVDISDCLDLETREQQIACYLARVDEAVEARESGTDAARDLAVSEPSPAARAESRRPEPPSTPPAAPQPGPQAQREAPAAAEQEQAEDQAEAQAIVARITSLRELQPDTYVIELDNGQVWRQSAPKRYLLREGAEVRLVPTRWGESYRLTDPDVGNFIQVQRVH